MTNTTEAANAWGEAWLNTQRKYLDTWMNLGTELAQRGSEVLGQGTKRDESPANPFATNPFAANPFSVGIEQWWKLMAPALPDESRQAAGRLMDMNKGYLQMGEQVWNLAHTMQNAAKAGQDWQQKLQDQIKAWQASFSCQKEGTAGWNTLCGLPLQHWRQLFSSYSMMPGDMEKNLRGTGPLGANTLQHALKGVLSTPAVGYTREVQEDWQEWGRLWLEHIQVMQKYEQLLAGVGSRTVDLIGTRIMDIAKEGKNIESLRQAYDLWVDCAEEAYTELANSSDFIATQARLTNTLMTVKHTEQKMVEQYLSGFNLPTRTELDTAHERIHRLRREVRRLRHRLEDSGVEELHKKIDQLRDEVRALQTESAQVATPAQPPRKSTAATPKKEG
ncbi:polyhydroxyalkanoate synthase subunit PhaE [Gammaproteobacteria bacterium]